MKDIIFVSLGTHERPFLRLVKEIDKLVEEGKIKEDVFVQLGFTDYKFKSSKIKSEKYMTQEDFDKTFRNAKIIITHGGSGNILEAISQKKPVIAVPRLSKFGEHVNDHQLQIVEEMSKNKQVIPVYEISDLLSAIKKAKKMKIKKLRRKKPEIFRIIEEKLKEWEK